MSQLTILEPADNRRGVKPPHPLGPIVRRERPRRPATARAIAALVFAGCAALWAVAATLEPDQAELGTHQQLGLPPCSLVMLFGIPCPTCGMTTAFSHTARGEFATALAVQPAGFAAALATLVVAWVAASVSLTGKTWAVNWYRVSPTWVALAVAAVVLGAWAYKLIRTAL